jgi:hypothetical protein
MDKLSFKRPLAVGASLVAALAFAVPAYAGEDDGDDEDTPAATQPAPQSSGGGSGGGNGGGSDSRAARGGVQTGAGALAVKADGSNILPLALVGGGVLVLTASGLTFRRRLEQDAV